MTETDDELWDDERFDVIDGYYMAPTVDPPGAAVVEPNIRVQEVATRKALPRDEQPTFGRVFTDHMALLDWDAGSGWTDPRVVPFEPFTLHPASAVFHGGQEIFDDVEAFRGVDGKVRLYRADHHCRRMAQGAARLGIPAIDPVLVLALLKALVTLDRDWVPRRPGRALYLRSTLIATEPFLGVRPSRRCLFFVIASPKGSFEEPALLPERVWVEDRPLASLLAHHEAKVRGYNRALLTDGREHRHVRDMGNRNLVVVLGDEVVTPALDGTILDGVTRDAVLTLCRVWGLRVSERSVTIDEILAADRDGQLREMFGCGTVGVIMPIGELDCGDRRIVINGGQPGALASRLYETITQIQYGGAPDSYYWLTPVD